MNMVFISKLKGNHFLKLLLHAVFTTIRCPNNLIGGSSARSAILENTDSKVCIRPLDEDIFEHVLLNKGVRVGTRVLIQDRKKFGAVPLD